jgi:hypothetical protein
MFAALLAASEAEPSKVPFVIVGLAIVAFAIVVTLAGLRAETFPSTRGARTGVCLVAVLLVATAMVTAVLTS